VFLLRMMLRLFTTIFGTTHPNKEDEAKYAWLLFALVVAIVVAMVGAAWVVVKFVR
jgi:hypothetical protein